MNHKAMASSSSSSSSSSASSIATPPPPPPPPPPHHQHPLPHRFVHVLDCSSRGIQMRSTSDESSGRSLCDNNDLIIDNEFPVANTKEGTTVFQSGTVMPIKAPEDSMATKHIPCPRCNSLDTKFCYYNNYNINQPRHFCKNCQRYWTAGGTLRNVAVGAGRRKRKQNLAEPKSVVIDSAAHSCETINMLDMEDPRTKLNLLTVNNESVTGKMQPAKFPQACMLSMDQLYDQNYNSLYGHTALTPSGAFCDVEFHALPDLKQLKMTIADPDLALEADGNASIDCGKLASESSSEKQQSTESASISSISTSQAFEKEDCYWKDTEVNKRGDDSNKDKPISVNAEHKQDVSLTALGSSSSACGFPQCNTASLPVASPCPLSWSLVSENRVVWPVVQQSTWAPPIDKSFLWSTVPWLPATMMYNAAKVSLVNSAGTTMKQPSTDPERRLWFPKTLRVNDPKDAALSSIWSTLGLENNELSISSPKGTFDCHAKKTAISVQSQHASPAQH